jgi:FKBP-type peptidyl-prolyl cis-trans isomerase (trigger factor)
MSIASFSQHNQARQNKHHEQMKKLAQKNVNTTSDQARILTSKDIGTMNEATLEFLIANAIRLLKGDQDEQIEQIALMNQRLKCLKAHRQRKLVLDKSRIDSTRLTPKPKPTPIGPR